MPLKPRQAALFETLLPQLALDLAEAGAGRSAHAVSARRRRGAAGNRLRRRRASDRAGASAIRAPASSAATLSSTASPRRWPASTSTSSTISACISATPATLIDWLPAGALARIDLLYPDPWPKRRHWKRRFVQDDKPQAAGAHFQKRRRIPLRHRHCRLCRLDAERVLRSPRFCLDGGAGRRLAQALARFCRHALRGQGHARRTHAGLFHFPEAIKRRRLFAGALTHLPEAHHALGGGRGQPLEILQRGLEHLGRRLGCRAAH